MGIPTSWATNHRNFSIQGSGVHLLWSHGERLERHAEQQGWQRSISSRESTLFYGPEDLVISRPEVTLPVIAKYMRVPKDDPALLQSQETFAKHLNLTLAPSLDGIQFILDFLAEQRPALKGKNPAEFVNVSFLKKLEEEGFFKKLSGNQ